MIALCGLFIPAVVYAQTSAEYEMTIRSRCQPVQTLLEQHQRRDLVVRINRGRVYQNLIDQMSALSTRLRNNKLSSTQFDSQLTTIKASIEQFRTAYNRYDDAMSGLIGIDCRTKPGEFATQLEVTRNLRSVVGAEIANITSATNRYRDIVVNFQSELNNLNNAVLGEQE